MTDRLFRTFLNERRLDKFDRRLKRLFRMSGTPKPRRRLIHRLLHADRRVQSAAIRLALDLGWPRGPALARIERWFGAGMGRAWVRMRGVFAPYRRRLAASLAVALIKDRHPEGRPWSAAELARFSAIIDPPAEARMARIRRQRESFLAALSYACSATGRS